MLPLTADTLLELLKTEALISGMDQGACKWQTSVFRERVTLSNTSGARIPCLFKYHVLSEFRFNLFVLIHLVHY